MAIGSARRRMDAWQDLTLSYGVDPLSSAMPGELPTRLLSACTTLLATRGGYASHIAFIPGRWKGKFRIWAIRAFGRWDHYQAAF